MDSVLRTIAVYGFLLIVFRISGKRSLAQMTAFDFILLLIMGNAVQNGLIGDDYSLTNAFVVVVTLMGLDVALSVWKQRSRTIGRLTEGLPLVIVERGRPLRERMDRERVDESDVMAAARERQGLERMAQIRYAVLERDGKISIIPEAG